MATARNRSDVPTSLVPISQPAFRPVTDGEVRVAPLCGMPDLLRKFQVNPEEVLAGTGLDLSVFDDPDNSVPFRTAGRVLHACVERTKCRHFGLLLGEDTGPRTLGLVGLLASQSADVGSALRNIVRYLHLHDRGAVAHFEVKDAVANLGYTVAEPDVAGSDQIADLAMAIACNIVRALCGPTWTPTAVLFARRRSADTRPLRRFFRAPLHFDAPYSALLFPSNLLFQTMPDADPALLKILQQQIEWLDARYGADFKAKVQRTIRTLLVSGQCSADKVASVFAMHRRTLGRRLREQGTTFESLLTATRYDAARQLLANTDMPIRQIASILGYSDVTALTRAFHHWSGSSPAQWRSTTRAGTEASPSQRLAR